MSPEFIAGMQARSSNVQRNAPYREEKRAEQWYHGWDAVEKAIYNLIHNATQMYDGIRILRKTA